MSPFLFCMWIHGNLCPLKGSEPTEQTRTSRKCLNLVPSSTALGHLINTGVGLRTIFLNCVLEGDIIPAGQAQVDAWWAFGTWQRICCPRGAPGSSRAHIYTYHPSTHLPTAGERGPQALTEGVGAPCSSPQLGQQLWPEEGDGHSPPQHHPHALRGCSTRAHHQQWRAAVSPSRPTSQGPKWWQMHVSRVKSHYTPPLACTHGHRTQRSLFFAAGRGNNTAVHRQLLAVPRRGLSLAAITWGFGPAKQTLHGASAKLFQLSLGQTFHETNWRAKNHTQKYPKAKENRIVEQQPWEEPKSVGRQQGKLVLSHCKLSFVQIQVILNDIFPTGTE